MINVRITNKDIDAYKREVLEQTVLVRIDEAAAIMAVSRSTVIRRVEEGALTPYNDTGERGRMRFLASELKRYVMEMRQQMS